MNFESMKNDSKRNKASDFFFQMMMYIFFQNVRRMLLILRHSHNSNKQTIIHVVLRFILSIICNVLCVHHMYQRTI